MERNIGNVFCPGFISNRPHFIERLFIYIKHTLIALSYKIGVLEQKKKHVLGLLTSILTGKLANILFFTFYRHTTIIYIIKVASIIVLF